MKSFGSIVLGFCLLFSLAFQSAVRADGFEKGDWALTLTGSGVSTNDLDDSAFTLNVAPSYFLTDEFELGVRQSLSYNDGFTGATAVFADFNVKLENRKFVPYVGVNLGYTYGEGLEDTWVVGPEAGLKYFVNDTTYLYGRVSYEFDIQESFDEGGFVYGVGIGFSLK